MRKVTASIKAAFQARRSATMGNTLTDGNHVWLHGNMILKREPDGSVWFTLAGWNTPTTRDRVNAFGAGVYQRNFLAYRDGVEIDSHKWYKI